MSKVKAPKSKGVPSKHLHARTTFLYQAATYLTLQTALDDSTDVTATGTLSGEQVAQTHIQDRPNASPLALQLGSHLQQVSRKAQLRLSVDLKRTICKGCNTILVSGRTATQTLENTSKGSKKPWADVLVLECKLCGGKKRFPVGAKKQEKISVRRSAIKDTTSIASMEDIRQMESAAQTSAGCDSSTA
jgi:ribonuclease P protein subunit RPR2